MFWSRRARAGGQEVEGVAEQIDQSQVAVVKSGLAPEPKSRAGDKWSREVELAIFDYVEGTASVALEHDRIVADIIAEKNRQHHDVGLICPYFASQRNQLLRCPVPVDAEIQSFDPLARQPRTGAENPTDDRCERLVLRNLHGLDIGVAQHRDSNRATRLVARVIGAAKTVMIDPQVGITFARVAAVSSGLERPSPLIVATVEVGVVGICDADAD